MHHVGRPTFSFPWQLNRRLFPPETGPENSPAWGPPRRTESGEPVPIEVFSAQQTRAKFLLKTLQLLQIISAFLLPWNQVPRASASRRGVPYPSPRIRETVKL